MSKCSRCDGKGYIIFPGVAGMGDGGKICPNCQGHCHGCRHLYSLPDGAGGGTYFCKKYPGLIKGEYGHWTDETDEPGPRCEDYER